MFLKRIVNWCFLLCPTSLNNIKSFFYTVEIYFHVFQVLYLLIQLLCSMQFHNKNTSKSIIRAPHSNKYRPRKCPLDTGSRKRLGILVDFRSNILNWNVNQIEHVLENRTILISLSAKCWNWQLNFKSQTAKLSNQKLEVIDSTIIVH